MGTLIGHIIPGLVLAILGVQHMLDTINSYYLKGPSKFISRFSYPQTGLPSKLKHLGLILTLSFSILAMVMEILDFPRLQLSFKLDSLEHATMFLHLSVFSGFSLYAELSNAADALSSLLGLLASSVFGQELFLLHFHSTDHGGIEGHYHSLLQLIILLSLVSSVAMTCSPSSFVAPLVLSTSIIFQGCWFLNMGLVLWTREFIPKGCFQQATNGEANSQVGGAVVCGSQEADFRARALGNLQFSWILAGILIFAGFICVVRAKKGSVRQTTAYERLP